ncbi:hypothetical protein GYMLUDRAFT_36332 [Collybiopsis luxurians FD-317 M1]|nr:hypothetical protein GYMLUDRAFT_36332 [Collybiopsis luxurians FD-317 M1]
MATRLRLDTDELPPLPPFKSSELKTQVFTHRSYFGRPNHIFEDHCDDPSPDNERLEHLGDTVLSMVVTNMMMEMFPTLRVGPSTKVRAMVVGNATLASIALRYRLPDQLRLHPAQALTLRASSHVQADLFESYVGGLFKDQGLEVVEKWLIKLLRPYALAAYRLVRTQHGLPPDSTPRSPSLADSPRSPPRSPFGNVNSDMTMTTVGHLSLFNQHVQRSNRSVEWIYTPTMPELDPSAQGDEQLISPGMLKGMKATTIWFVKVIVDGECLGQGKGGTKKIARNEAAKRGLESLGVHVYPDLYFKPPIGFRGPRFFPWSPFYEGTRGGNSDGKGHMDNSQHNFSRLRPEALLNCLLHAVAIRRSATCPNVKRLWVEEGREFAVLHLNQSLSKSGFISSIERNIRQFFFTLCGRLHL